MKMNTFSSHFFKVILAKTVFPVLALFVHAPQLVLDVGGESGADPGHAEGILMSSVTPRHTPATHRDPALPWCCGHLPAVCPSIVCKME